MSAQPLPVAAPALTDEHSTLLARLVDGLDAGALWWLSGYTAALAQGRAGLPLPLPRAAASADAQARLTIVYGSQTGNSRRVAEKLARDAELAGLAVRLLRADTYPQRELAQERLLYLVISTHGDGDPPDDARDLVEFIAGRRAPKLPELKFAVLALGDSSYPLFCATGRQLDARLSELGARRLFAAGEADVDFERVASAWAAQALMHAREALESQVPPASVTPLRLAQASSSALPASGSPASGSHASARQPSAVSASANQALVDQASMNQASINQASMNQASINQVWNRDQPFPAEVLLNQRITASGSQKHVRHLELSLAGAGFAYTPGDALGVWHHNPAALVDAVLAALSLDGDAPVDVDGRILPLRDGLGRHRELTRLSRPFLAAHAGVARAADLQFALAPEQARELATLLATHQLIDVLRRWPARWQAADFVAALRPLAPRLYSIASSQLSVGEEAHLTVDVLGYHAFGEAHLGAASRFLSDLGTSASVPIYIEQNERFRLPADGARDVIMIGPGTGVAPFRAFLQHRAAVGSSGRHWLFFGNPRFRSDFLYQLEWQAALRDGRLHELDLAFSRDGESKVYVQHRIAQRGAELHAWLDAGAHLYVCGGTAMGKDVHATLRQAVAAARGLDDDGAECWLRDLQQQGRYSRDVY